MSAASDPINVLPKAVPARGSRETILAGPILPALFWFSIPTIAVLLAQTAVNVAETIYVGRLGTDALAGVALVFPVYMLMLTMSAGGIGSGVASAVARASGAGRKDDADALVRHAVVLALVCGALFSAVVILAGPMLYASLGGSGATLHAALVYSGILFAGAIPLWIVNLLASSLRGVGNVRTPALVTLGGAAVMIPASPLLIFGLGPVPAMGIAGAGIAFLIFYVAAMGVLLRHLLKGYSGLTLKRGPLERRLFGEILKVGIPAALSTAQTNLAVIVVTGTVGRFGSDALAGYGVAARLDYVLIPILFGLSSAVLSMVGINIGAGQGARARRIGWYGTFAGMAFTAMVGLVAALFPWLWVDLFTKAPAVAAAATTYLKIVAPFYVFFGLGFVTTFAAQGAGHALWAFFGVTGRLVVAAGLGWYAVALLGAGLPTLFAIVAAGMVIYGLVCAGAMLRPRIWRLAA